MSLLKIRYKVFLGKIGWIADRFSIDKSASTSVLFRVQDYNVDLMLKFQHLIKNVLNKETLFKFI